MDDVIHFARLDQPSDALRAICGAWRSAQNWTTVAKAATCPVCAARLRGRAQQGDARESPSPLAQPSIS